MNEVISPGTTDSSLPVYDYNYDLENFEQQNLESDYSTDYGDYAENFSYDADNYDFDPGDLDGDGGQENNGMMHDAAHKIVFRSSGDGWLLWLITSYGCSEIGTGNRKSELIV